MDTNFSCLDCLYTTRWDFSLKEHFKKHNLSRFEQYCQYFNCIFPLNDFKCFLCTFQTETWKEFRKHLTKFHKNETIINIEYINKLVKTFGDFYFCPQCNYATRWRTNLQKHFKNRHAFADKILKCNFCDYRTSNKPYLNRHIRRKHDDSKQFKCNLCPYAAKQNVHLREHNLRCHTSEENIKWFYCKYCTYRAKSKGGLTVHISRVHSSENYVCPHCRVYKATCKEYLDKHIRSRHLDIDQIKWIDCEVENCNFKSKTKQNLKYHILKYHTDESKVNWYKCGKCEYKTLYHGSLKDHEGRRHEKESDRKYNCPTCKKKFVTANELKNHVISKHTPDSEIKFFKCNICDYKAKLKRTLLMHTKTHTGEVEQIKLEPIGIEQVNIKTEPN